MRRVVAVVACVTGLLWVAPVTGAAPAPAQAAAGAAAGAASPSCHTGRVPPVSGMTAPDPRV